MIFWYYVPKGAHLAAVHEGKREPMPVLVARLSAVFGNASEATVDLKLTAAGHELLNHSKHLEITTKAMFMPNGGIATTSTKTFALK
ncbi:MAG: hypothetical protein ACLP0J_05595 [Solirubrobacteraceae bacterium]